MTSTSNVARGLINLDEEMEAALRKLQFLGIVAKPITSPPPVPTVSDIKTIFRQFYQAAPQPLEISYFPPDFILQYNDKESYDTILSYKILIGNNYAFSLSPWNDNARCHIEIWKTPVTIDIHGIPPYAFHIKSLCTLLDPHCDIEAYNMDKETGICTVEGTALSVNSIPTTGFFSYNDRSSTETIIYTFPVTMKTTLLTKPAMSSSISHKSGRPNAPEEHHNPSTSKDEEPNEDSDLIRECNRATFEAEIEDERQRNNPPAFNALTYSGESSDDDDPNDAYYYPDSDREPKHW